MNANSTRNVIVESGGTQVVGHVGLHALGMFRDRLGVGEALSQAVGWAGSEVPGHDRGKVDGTYSPPSHPAEIRSATNPWVQFRDPC